MKRTAVALLVVAIWMLSAVLGEPHRLLPASAPETQFSSERAQQVLTRLLGPERPHPVSSAENAAVRARLLQEFAALGIHAHTYQAFACDPGRGFERIVCATANDVIAEVLPGPGRSVVMMAHYDSVPAGPGAADNMSGVAAVLEAARALRASRIEPQHPVLALITDGEEAGMLGAYAFLQNPDSRARVGAVVNVDARGTAGPSLLFQTSPGDGPLVDLYVHSVPAPATSSLYAEIYRRLPNDTDLTPFLRAGFPCFNFAFIENVRYYHSPLDQRRRLSDSSLQMQGDNLLGVVSALVQTPYPQLRGEDAVYLSLFNRIVPRVRASAALALAVFAWLVIALAAWIERRGAARRATSDPSVGGGLRVDGGLRVGGAVGARVAARAEAGGALLRAALMPPALILGSALSGFVLAGIAEMLSGTRDPSYAYPLALRLALALGVWTIALVVARWTDARAAAASGWLWIAGLGVLSAALLPGLSPYFIFPALIAAIALLGGALAPGGWTGRLGRGALLLAAIASLVVWTGLLTAGESVMGLRLHLLFTVPAALGLLGVMPLLAATRGSGAVGERASGSSAGATAASAALAVTAAAAAGLLPPFSAASPQRLNLIYFQNRGAAQWVADTSFKGGPAARLPRSLLKAGRFQLARTTLQLPSSGPEYVADAGTGRFPLPTATVVLTPSAIVQLHGSENADAMMLFIPSSAGVRSVDLGGQHLSAPAGWQGDTWLLCVSHDCRDATITLTGARAASELEFAEVRYGLPPFGRPLADARPPSAMASQSGDELILEDSVRLQ